MFVVTKRFGRAETRVKEFTQELAAESFILEKLREDRSFKLMATYCLYEGADLLKEYTQDNIPVDTASDESAAADASSASQKGSGQSFRPTPFNTSPRIGPQSWISKDEDNKEKDK
jgi:hypothetical protein